LKHGRFSREIPSYSPSSPPTGYDAAGNIVGYNDTTGATPGSTGPASNAWGFSYDTLNRLTGGADSQSGSTGPTYYCWTYDAFGNRTLQAISNAQFTAVSGNNCQAATDASLTTSWATYAANNWITGTNTAPGGDAYDPAGDVIADGVNQYLYDAEGRICAVTNTALAGTTMTGYLYDADGTRVAKGAITSWSCDPTVNGFTTTSDYVLGPGGEQMTEMDMGANNRMAWEHTNVWAGSKLLATYDNNGLHFHFDDWLGTRRAQTDYAGVMEQTCASLPYGDNLNCTSSIQNPTEHHFTGKERDAESGNDYFEARYYANSMGRFMSPDWSAKADPVPYAKLEDPQTLNLYAYVTNNPLAKRDLDGHWMAWQHVDISERAYDRAHIARNQSVINAIRDVDGGGHNPYTGYVFHHGDFGRAQDAPGSQAFHFLRDSGQTQMAAYNASMSRITNEANSAYSALQRGDQAGFANAMGGAGHDIQDSFAHTWRENGIGAITHLECYNCSGSEMDHQHPDYQPVATGGVLGPEAQASVDATADFLTLMNGASNMTQSQFQSGLQSFENKWFQQKLPH
jgi:RHS repeat-associated protein